MFRFRKLVVQPGGIVPWHEHSARPANILVVEGSITEYRSTCKVPIEHAAGDVDAEFGAARPLVEEQRQGAGHPLLGRHPAAGHGRAHDVSRASPRTSSQSLPTFPAGQAGNVEPFPENSNDQHRADGADTLRMVAADSMRFGIIALIAFLTLVDLFAAQAILPSLVDEVRVSRATMGFAVNASTFGMAIAGIVVALFGRNIDRRNGIWISLAVLAIPTTLLSMTDDITTFALLRVAQGLCMSTAFTLTVAYLAEHFSPAQATGALAAYVTGNVASNFFGRIMSAAVADTFGISTNFLTFAALNIAGAAARLG